MVVHAAVSTALGWCMQRCRPLVCMHLHINNNNMHCCMQVFCNRLNQMGCILPNEPTCASVAAAALVAQHAERALFLTDADIDFCYQGVKARLKQLYKSEPARFLQTLPATPGQLVRDDRAFALTLFSREEPPVACPLNMMAVECLRSRVCMRGGGLKRNVPTLHAGALHRCVPLAVSTAFPHKVVWGGRCRPLFFFHMHA